MRDASEAATAEAVLAAERERLVRVAYRMLGSLSDAEDVVQGVSVEFLRAPEPENPEGWLTTVTVRRAIDALRVRQREQSYRGPWLPEPLLADRAPGHAQRGHGDPAALAERLDTLSTGFLVLAETLTPPQRAVVVLRSLEHSHAEIAEALGISVAASRQLDRRARARLAEREPVGEPGDAAAERTLLTAFLSAARDGDVAGLTALLHAEVIAFNDGGGRTRAARRPLLGPDRVARFAAGVSGLHDSQAARPVWANGRPAAVVTLSGVAHLVTVEVRDGRIARITDLSDPGKLGGLPEAGPINRPGTPARRRPAPESAHPGGDGSRPRSG
ncbi:sigma-70 family RNA polymerase sigma factor [Leucobacter sp. M11]|uniref:sigma-70 family RNA polymerase sigma factor n=1 Tax=Leucobacter sp. M11 TaxID=2993565 RepID=UPI002D809182|nr:sigma-70 family RNA polymerase sigma factor [Leucobacter sp. M11]MEB4615604.1 sigma-70 family RNA polymerase sigma factor [Leucobacter sp. M11]